MKKTAFLLSAAFAAMSLLAAPKYVFLFIGDGMSTPQRMVAEEYARATGYGPLAMNNFPNQCLARTRSANAVITDSAAAATAIACGVKTDNCMLGVRPDGTRVESVAETAHRLGRKVGIMTTVTIVHATPAGFYAHRKSRGLSYEIALDMLGSGFEFFAGGGVYNKYDDRRSPEYRGNIFDLARKAGYRIVSDKDAFEALPPGDRTWGVFTNDFNREAMPFALDGMGTSPSLARIVERAVEMLDGPKGFFVMCEGGKLDYVAHANDPAGTLREVIALDEAVKVAVRFAERHPDTLIVTTGDHETGGLSMGFAGTGSRFDVKTLAFQKCTAAALDRYLKDQIVARREAVTFADARALIEKYFGFRFESADNPKDPMLLTAKEQKEFVAAFENDRAAILAGISDTKAHDVKRNFRFAATAKRFLCARAGVGWASSSHTALPTMTTAFGPGGERFRGFMENADIAKNLREILEK